MSVKVRKMVYTWLTPVAALLIFYGLTTSEEVQLWLVLAGTVLLGGEGALAAVNTKTPVSNAVEDAGDHL